MAKILNAFNTLHLPLKYKKPLTLRLFLDAPQNLKLESKDNTINSSQVN